MYIVFLARTPESKDAENAPVENGKSFKELLQEVTSSDEFDFKYNEFLNKNVISGWLEMTSSELERGLDWLEDLGGETIADRNWYGLYAAGLNFARRNGNADVTNGIELAREMAGSAGALTVRDAVADIFQLDRAWLRRRNAFTQLMSNNDDSDLPAATLAALRKQMRPLHPLLSRPKEDLYPLTRRDMSLAELLDRQIDLALEGRLTHWLWDAPTYLHGRNEHFALPTSRRWPTAAEPYLDFLLRGDAAGVSPHFLFSHHAYRVLNRSLGEDEATFAHFAFHGVFDDLPTSAIFDPVFYKAMNPDVARHIDEGPLECSLQHFLDFGLREGRAFSPDFDRDFYLHRYPDVRTAIEGGSFGHPEVHFMLHGLADNRQPNPYFNPDYYAARYPLVGKEMRALGINSLLEHFLLVGKARGYKASDPLVGWTPDMLHAKAIFERRAMRSTAAIRRQGLTIAEPTGDCLVSVIVPVQNQAPFTGHFLAQAAFANEILIAREGRGAEVIVVNNGSTDNTDELLAAVDGITVLTFGSLGFPAAVNTGAMAASGEYLLIVNNDIEFDPEAFWRAVVRLRDNPNWGVVGAKLILPNETLQEFGSVILPEWGTMGLSRGAAPFDRYFTGVHEVDYVSGCFFGVRRAEFMQLGGLDEAFTPGYYEETDFCVRVRRDLDKVVVVDGELEVRHYESASFSKGRPPGVTAPLFVRNRGIVRAKHSDTDPQHISPLTVAAGSGRRKVGHRTRLLVVNDMIPHERLGSGFNRDAEVLRCMAELRIPFDILALHPSEIVDDYEDDTVQVFRAWLPGQDAGSVLRGRGGDYSHIWVARTHNLQILAGALIEAQRQFAVKVVCDTEAIGVRRNLEMARLAGRTISDAEVDRIVRSQFDTGVKVDRFIAVNEFDRRLLARAGYTNTDVINQCHPYVVRSTAAAEDRSGILAVGAVHAEEAPNLVGLDWFITHVLPKVRAAQGEVTINVVGPWKAPLKQDFLKRHPNAGLVFHGSVSSAELSAWYGRSRIAIAPTLFAAGIPGKVIESMLAGLPIVMTDLLASQLDLEEHDRAFAIAPRDDGGEGFARWTTKLLADDAAWSAVRAAQTTTADQRYSIERMRADVSETLREVGISLPGSP